MLCISPIKALKLEVFHFTGYLCMYLYANCQDFYFLPIFHKLIGS